MTGSGRVGAGVSLLSSDSSSDSNDQARRLTLLTLLILVMGSLLFMNTPVLAGHSGVDMSIYPPPKPGYVKTMIHVKPNPNEHFLKIELVIGRYIKVDTCNFHWYTGTLKEKEASGYPYYELRNIEGPYATQIGCVPWEERIKFVRVNLASEKIDFMRYNSQLPIVVYVPHGFNVHYRIWKGNPKTVKAIVEY